MSSNNGNQTIFGYGPGTGVVDGQRTNFPTSYAYTPTQYGPQTTGVPQVSPQQPPLIGAANGGGTGVPGAMEGVGGYGTSGNNALATTVAARNPHNLKVSPVWWAVGFMAVGLLALNGVHWRKTTLTGADEHAHLGGVHEGAEAGA